MKVGIFDMKQSKAARNLAIAAGLVKLPALKVCTSIMVCLVHFIDSCYPKHVASFFFLT